VQDVTATSGSALGVNVFTSSDFSSGDVAPNAPTQNQEFATAVPTAQSASKLGSVSDFVSAEPAVSAGSAVDGVTPGTSDATAPEDIDVSHRRPASSDHVVKLMSKPSSMNRSASGRGGMAGGLRTPKLPSGI